jgi:predicted O-methyltransferase YrrM
VITTSKREKQYIRQQALRVGATRLLEVGCFKGQTTQILSHVAGDDGYVVAIDPMKWASKPAHVWEWLDGVLHPFSYEPTFWRNVSRSGYDNVRLIKRLSHDPEVLEDPDPRLKDLDLVFIDGEHLYDTAMTDFRNWGSRVRSGGRVLLHDCIDRFPGVQRAVAEIQADPRFSVTWPTSQSGTIATVEVRSA